MKNIAREIPNYSTCSDCGRSTGLTEEESTDPIDFPGAGPLCDTCAYIRIEQDMYDDWSGRNTTPEMIDANQLRSWIQNTDDTVLGFDGRRGVCLSSLWKKIDQMAGGIEQS